jgi:hypothetical protein
MQPIAIPEHVRRRIAVTAQADPRTVTRFCKGVVIRGMVGERIRNAMRAEGLLPDERDDRGRTS